MKTTKVLLIVFASFALISCGGGGGGDGGDTTACGGSTKGCIIGTAIDSQSGAAVGGAVITTGGAAAMTVGKAAGTTLTTANAQGWFSATGVEEGSDVTFCFQAAGYVTTCRNFQIEGTKTLNMPPVKMIKRTTTALTYDAATGATISDTATGAQLTIAGGITCAADRATVVTGTITCYLTPLNYIDAAPGNFTGVRTDGTQVAIITTGMMDITCEDSIGNEVNLCTELDSPTANVRIPLFGPLEDCAGLPSPIESWDFDEATGLWTERGTFTKTCGATLATSYYSGNINHLSWWNADRPEHFTCLTGFVKDLTGATANGQATVECQLSEGADTTVRLKRYAQTDSTGAFCVQVVRGAYYSCVAKKGEFTSAAVTGTASTEEAACGGSGCTDIGTILLTDPVFRTTLTWGASSSAVPRDLDSHFVNSEGTTHIYYLNKDIIDAQKGSLTTAPYVELDTDDTDYSGPENTTVVPGVAAGKYRFCVHNFSGDGDLTTSQAKIVVSGSASGLPRLYDVPTSPTGQNVWQVYEVTIGSDNSLSFMDLNKLVSASDAITGCFQ